MSPFAYAECESFGVTVYERGCRRCFIAYLEWFQQMAVRLATRRWKRHARYTGNPNKLWRAEHHRKGLI